MSNLLSNLEAELQETLLQQFQEECEDRLSDINMLLENIINDEGDYEAQIKDIARSMHTLKGIGQPAGYPGMSLIMHRMEDYFKQLTLQKLTADNIRPLYKFIDKVNALRALEKQPEGEDLKRILNDLPSHFSEDDVVKTHNIDAIVIMPQSIQSKIIDAELKSCGFTTTRYDNSFEAIQMSALATPDLIVVSAIVDSLSGIEICNIYRAINATKEVPIILVTSYSEHERSGLKLPEKTMIAEKGGNFADGFSKCIIELGLFHK